MDTQKIQVLDQETVGKIAAGEVIERPLSVVKELVENSIDAGADAITVELKEGGISFLRVTDNGCGIPSEEVRTAFREHATSKIRSSEDLFHIRSLGFRGEALPSIAAVSRTELITKTKDSLTGIRILIEGGKELVFEEVGAPEGTTFLVRDLFYNLPARKKFLKSARSEGGAITALMERLALSHTGISFQLVSDGRSVLQTGGNGRIKDVIYQIYGRDIAENLLPVEADTSLLKLSGYVGKPNYSRGNRDFENYFINGRYAKSSILQKSIEDAYHSFLMQHQYPFTALMIEVDGEEVDVNVHPQKMSLRFQRPEEVYENVYEALRRALFERELVPTVSVDKGAAAEREKKAPALPEPFEKAREYVKETAIQQEINLDINYLEEEAADPEEEAQSPRSEQENPLKNDDAAYTEEKPAKTDMPPFRILGQVFQTYWIVEQEDRLLMVDQHAAHEKVIFERLMKRKSQKERLSQSLFPGLVLNLSSHEEQALQENLSLFIEAGFEIESFGGRSYTITAVPSDIYGLDEKQYFMEMLDELAGQGKRTETEELYYRIATMSCKAAVKGNQRLSMMEFEALMKQLLACDNPYQCPHGRPTMIAITKYDVEKRFKRIL